MKDRLGGQDFGDSRQCEYKIILLINIRPFKNKNSDMRGWVLDK